MLAREERAIREASDDIEAFLGRWFGSCNNCCCRCCCGHFSDLSNGLNSSCGCGDLVQRRVACICWLTTFAGARWIHIVAALEAQRIGGTAACAAVGDLLQFAHHLLVLLAGQFGLQREQITRVQALRLARLLQLVVASRICLLLLLALSIAIPSLVHQYESLVGRILSQCRECLVRGRNGHRVKVTNATAACYRVRQCWCYGHHSGSTFHAAAGGGRS